MHGEDFTQPSTVIVAAAHTPTPVVGTDSPTLEVGRQHDQDETRTVRNATRVAKNLDLCTYGD